MPKHSQEKQSIDVSESCRIELEQTLASRNFSVRFRPLFAPGTGVNFGYMARVYGSQESPIRCIDRLFAVARQADNLHKLTKRYLEAALFGFGNPDKPDLMDQVIKAHPRHLISGFIVTDNNGHYIGKGAVQDLMREITNMQIQAARYANPLTQLPGNVAINNHFDSLLASQVSCVVAYCDLDHFKPFNDV